MNTKGTPPPSPPGGVAHRFPPRVSGNPGGRPSIAKALKANGTTTTDVLAKLAKIALDALDDTTASQRSREYAHQWLTHYILGKPKEYVEITGDGGGPPTVDWSTLPIERRRELLAAAEVLGAVGSSGDGPTEH